MKIKSVGLDASKLLLSNSASALLLHLIEHDLDENHMDIIASMLPQQLPALIESLLHYIARIPLPEGSEDKLYLKQERAIMVLADALYAFDGVAVDAAAIASTISSNIDTRMMIANAIESKRSNGSLLLLFGVHDHHQCADVLCQIVRVMRISSSWMGSCAPVTRRSFPTSNYVQISCRVM